MTVQDARYAARMSEAYKDLVERVANSMETYADRVRKEGLLIETAVGTHHGAAARSAIAELQTMLGNLSLWQLLAAAEEADEALREAAEAKPDLKTPQEWAATRGVRILDPDGWREEGSPPFDQPCEWSDDVGRRLWLCTVMPLEEEVGNKESGSWPR
jgi:hypothetical protein